MTTNSGVAIAAALIAGAFAFISLVLGKDNKTSEFRQAWIDGLRQDISDFIGSISHLLSYWLHIRDTSKTDVEFEERSNKLLEQQNQILFSLVSLRCRILLRLNPKEHVDFIDHLERVYLLISDGSLPESHEVIQPHLKELTELSQELLKAEWVRVKRGEPSFWITRAIALGVVGGLGLVSFGVYLHWTYIA